ncbi:MAG TPA: hypothetical protein VHQ20_01780 [Patescibacteria group bacterium]|jgi:DNA polymerase III delta prime subunit|nr:hypothetical protein [Patescibacteria group bacterium]
MTKNTNFTWPETAPENITATLDGFLVDPESMPHAYLFIGGEGMELATSFASLLTGQKFPNVDSVQFDVAEGLGVEGIREVTQLAALMPVAGNRKVIVLQNMDQANTAVLNALLKNLEEPPVHAIFILLSSRPLLATVMSRCQVMSLPKLVKENSDDLTEVMELLETNRTAGLAERLSLVTTLADLKDDLLPRLLEQWMQKQTQELKAHPEKYKTVRVTMETLQGLRSNFNKKMVLQNFVMTGLN